ncbi:hypothetical protein [Paenibacillus sp. FSL P2-0136]|uniref:hypothetical protein n=1 Tax=unclassified Paenibacillus TaxID=185978 RepID=UPI0030D809B0
MKQSISYLETPTGYFLQFDPNDNGGYRTSPIDSIMFARTGMDGIHFSFLTDFSSVTDLSLAPIVRVDPMDFGNCIKIVAKNIRDFFTLHFSGHEDLLLNEFESKEEYIDYLEEQDHNEEDNEYFDKKKWYQQKNEVRENAMQHFGFQPILDGYEYIQEARTIRQNELILNTIDGLGVTARDKFFYKATPHPWHLKEIPITMVKLLQLYIAKSEPTGFFGFIRDCQSQGVNDTKIIQAIYEQLISLNLPSEAKRLLFCMDIYK